MSQCLQYSVSLFCEENVHQQKNLTNGKDNQSNPNGKAKVIVKQSCQEFSFGYDEVSFTKIPHTVRFTSMNSRKFREKILLIFSGSISATAYRQTQYQFSHLHFKSFHISISDFYSGQLNS